jgi:hypothetical protein
LDAEQFTFLEVAVCYGSSEILKYESSAQR